MNAGLSNLSTLKAWLLPASMQASTDYDDQILAIGKGVVGAMEGYCNRSFQRVVGDTFEISGDRMHVVLPRYPVEAQPTIELREDLATGYVSQTYTDLVIDHLLSAGLIKFGAVASTSSSRLRFTYTGGYWWELLEPTDGSYPTTQPANSTAVPDDLLLAWRLQCEHVWTQRDKLGLTIGDKPDNVYSGALAKIKLLDGVIEILGNYRRFALT